MNWVSKTLINLYVHCCGLLGCHRGGTELVVRAGDQVPQASMGAVAVTKWPCTASPWLRFLGEDPPMIKSTVDLIEKK